VKTITFQFVTGNEAASALIRWKTDSEISHVNVVMPDGKLLGALLDGGVRVRDANYCKFTLQILVTVPLTDTECFLFWDSIAEAIGQQYDRAGIVGIALGNNLCAPGEVFCSELITRYVNQNSAAKIVHIAKDPSKVDPEMLRVVLTAIPGATEKRIEEQKVS
jgi:hypothetical protein